MDRQARIVAGEGKDMTPEDILRMALETGDVETDRRGRETFSYDSYGLERFAALVAAAEREACAKLAETTVCDTHLPTGVQIYGSKAAAAIRARGNK
jgi:hypothetical protein